MNREFVVSPPRDQRMPFGTRKESSGTGKGSALFSLSPKMIHAMVSGLKDNMKVGVMDPVYTVFKLGNYEYEIGCPAMEKSTRLSCLRHTLSCGPSLFFSGLVSTSTIQRAAQIKSVPLFGCRIRVKFVHLARCWSFKEPDGEGDEDSSQRSKPCVGLIASDLSRPHRPQVLRA